VKKINLLTLERYEQFLVLQCFIRYDSQCYTLL